MKYHAGIFTAGCIAATPSIARAGMPSIGLSEVAQLRFEAISFFLIVFLLAALAIKLLWNWLGSDFAWLPRLTYAKAIGLTTLWGLLFVIVLTMISGARELMTPGAWIKKGATYKLNNEEASLSPASQSEQLNTLTKRNLKLGELAVILRSYAAAHEGSFPSADEALTLSSWEVPQGEGLRYAYWPNRKVSDPPRVLVSEPNTFEGPSLALMTDGEIKPMSVDELMALSAEKATP